MKLIRSLFVRSLFVIVFFTSSFAGTALPVQNVSDPLARTNTTKILRQLGGFPCPDESSFTCVTIEVPLDHFNPADARTIPVTFAVHPASGSRRGMFVVATGGPGISGISVADSYSSAYDPKILRRFDVVFFDQRGVGLSGGLACPQAAVAYYQRDARSETAEQQMALVDGARTFAEDCVNELDNPEILPYLGTAQAIEDLEYFRKLMQDGKFWLYGESYGTQYSQTYAAKYGSHLAGLILDGTVDLTLTGFEFYAQQAQAFSDTLTATLQACNDDPACAEQVDGAIEAYDEAVQILSNGAVGFDFPLADGGSSERELTLTDLEVVASAQMYTEADRMMFNRALASSAAYDSAAPLARLLYLSLGVDSQTLDVVPDPSYSDAEFYGVECQDYGYPGDSPEQKAQIYLEAGDQVVPSIPRLGSIFYGDLPCAFWPDSTAELSRPEPLTAAGIPTLVLNATADPATPLSNAISVYKRLKNGYLITQEGGPHVIFGWGNACPDDLVTDFLVNGRTPTRRITRCPGVIVDEYVPVTPTDASEFENLLDALGWTETEINYLPEYYYWDGFTPTSVGCPLGGSLAFDVSGANNVFTLNECSFARDFAMTGTGIFRPNRDQFILTISTQGRWQCDITYTRTGTRTRVRGNCDGETQQMDGEMFLPKLDAQIAPLTIPSK